MGMLACSPAGLFNAPKSPERAAARAAIVSLANATRLTGALCYDGMVLRESKGQHEEAVSLGEFCELGLQCSKKFVIEAAILVDSWDTSKPQDIACAILRSVQCLESLGDVVKDDTLKDAIQFAKPFTELCKPGDEVIITRKLPDGGISSEKI